MGERIQVVQDSPITSWAVLVRKLAACEELDVDYVLTRRRDDVQHGMTRYEEVVCWDLWYPQMQHVGEWKKPEAVQASVISEPT